MMNKIFLHIGVLFFCILFFFTVDIFLTFSQLNDQNSIVAYIYISFYLVISTLILYIILKYYIEFKRYAIINDKSKDDFENFSSLDEEKKVEVLKYISTLVSNSNDSGIETEAKSILAGVGVVYSDDLKEKLDKLFEKLNEKAKSIIMKETVNITILTGISQKSSLDMIIVFFNNIKLIRELLRIYGYKTNTYNTLVLVRKVVENTFAAGTIEQSNILDTLGVLGGSFVGGVTNGFLMIRVGNSCMESLSIVGFEKNSTISLGKELIKKLQKDTPLIVNKLKDVFPVEKTNIN